MPDSTQANSSPFEYDGLPVSDEFSLIEGAARGLAVIWDLAAAINVGSWRSS